MKIFAGTPVRAVLFDLDDTLWPIEPVIAQAEQALHAWLTMHVPAVAEQWSVDRLRQRRTTMLQENPHYQIDLYALRHGGLVEAFVASGADPIMVDAAMAVFTQMRNAVTPFEDVVPALTRMRRRWQLGSISNGFANLETIGLASYFATSLAAHCFGKAKPDPAIFQAACEALGVDPAQAVYVGDDLHLDVVAAKNAGLRAVWMNRFQRCLPSEIEADAVCTNLLELEDWLGS